MKFLLISFLFSFPISALSARSCPAICPNNAAQFCNLNAQEVCISGSSQIDGDLTVCGNIFNPGGEILSTNFNSEIFFTAGDMSGLQIGQEGLEEVEEQIDDQLLIKAPLANTPKCVSSFPTYKILSCGWEMPLDRQKGVYYVSIPFGMPKNINLAITPVIDIHFFTAGKEKEGDINFGIGANFLQDKQDTGDQMTFQKLTGNITVTSPQVIGTIRHFMISIPIDDITMKPQSLGQLYIARIDINKGPLPEYQDSVYIAAVNFRYRMEPII